MKYQLKTIAGLLPEVYATEDEAYDAKDALELASAGLDNVEVVEVAE